MHFVWIFVCCLHVLCNKSALIKNKIKKGLCLFTFPPEIGQKLQFSTLAAEHSIGDRNALYCIATEPALSPLQACSPDFFG